MSETFLGIFEGHYDPAVAIVRDGEVLAYSEEERHNRVKHAPRMYPERALRYCLDAADLGIDDIAAVAVNWDIPAYTNGSMAAFFDEIRAAFQVDPATMAWQNSVLRQFSADG